MSNCHSDMFSQKGGKCPTVILTSFLKRRKMSNCHSDKFSQKRRKMSNGHSDKISQKGGKCPKVILTNFLKWRKMSTSGLTRYQKKEENIHRLFLQVFNNRRKMSLGHSHKFSQEGGKCPMVILRKFHKKE